MTFTTHLLPDEPTTQDAFGTHDRVAKSIAELITSEKSAKAVAVIGPWGYGKSSVLHMVQARLVGTAHVFIFDAWTHEGDPLRRTFLEGLIDSLWPDNPPKEINELRQEILLRKKTKEETTAPLLTWEAKVLGFSLLVVPAGLAMFATMVRMQKPSWTMVTFALVLALLPLLFLILLALGVGFRKAMLASRRLRKALIASAISIILIVTAVFVRSPSASWKGIRVFASMVAANGALTGLIIAIILAVVSFGIVRSASSFPQILPLLLNRTVTTIRSESIEPIEPSSIEFQRWFRSIVGIYQKNQGKKLVIAIDNLDRVDASLARQLWATMRTFFEFASGTGPSTERIWLLVAFDKQAIQKLWESGDPDSFVKKTFQASFRIPSLVLLHRDDFLLKQLTAAFPFCGRALLEPVVRLYGLKHARNISTPRDITSFVNSIGSIHRQWPHDEIPLVRQAQYVLAAESGNDIMSILTTASTNPESPEELVGPNWQESLAAIHFNVPPKDAVHIFMPPAIINSLLSEDVTKLKDLAKIRGFGDILSEVAIINREAWKQSGSLAKVISALDQVETNENDEGIKRTWRIWTKAAVGMEKWEPLPSAARALSTLIRRSGREETQIKYLLKSAGRAVPRAADGSVDNSDQALIKFAENLRPVLNLLPALPPSCELTVYGSARTYVNLLSAIEATKHKKFTEIASRLDTEARDEIPTVLGEIIGNVQLKEGSNEVIKALAGHYTKMNWKPVIGSAELLFANTNNNFLQMGFKAAFEALLILANSVRAATASLEALGRNGTLHHYLGVADGPQSKDLAILLLLLFSDGDPTSWPGNAKIGARRYEEWLHNPDSATAGVIASLAVDFGLTTRLGSRQGASKSAEKALASVLGAISGRPEKR